MKDIHARSHRTLPRSKEGLDRVERRVLHGHDHDRCRQDGWQSSVLEAIGKVFRGDHQRERTPGSYRYRRHKTAPVNVSRRKNRAPVLVVRGRPRRKRLLNHNEPRTAPVPCPSQLLRDSANRANSWSPLSEAPAADDTPLASVADRLRELIWATPRP